MFLDVFRSRRMAALFLLGFGSGLPLYLTGSTLQAWLTSEHVSLEQIAAFSLVGLAYTFKFAWAPLLDRFALPLLGRRRGWILASQLGLVLAIAAMGTVDPVAAPVRLATLAVVVAVLSATQDIVFDAYNTDVLAPHERAAGASIGVIGYRTAMMLTGTIALIMADHLPWRLIYATMAAFMGVGIVGTILATEPPAPARRVTFAEAFYVPFVDFVQRLGWLGTAHMLGFTAFYTFGDYFAQSLLITFFKRGVGFEFTEIALVYKLLGFAGIFIGGVTGGSLAARFGVKRMLIAFGILQAVTQLLYAWLAIAGKSYVIFGIAVLIHITSAAMGTAVFVGMLMSFCSPVVSATQFALLTSFASVGQRVFGPLADNLVDAVGWAGFFVCTALMAIPGLILSALLPAHDTIKRA
jgi:MFS transporter, PAT family, beta-lactamase induction signal transducer AmpG